MICRWWWQWYQRSRCSSMAHPGSGWRREGSAGIRMSLFQFGWGWKRWWIACKSCCWLAYQSITTRQWNGNRTTEGLPEKKYRLVLFKVKTASVKHQNIIISVFHWEHGLCMCYYCIPICSYCIPTVATCCFAIVAFHLNCYPKAWSSSSPPPSP